MERLTKIIESYFIDLYLEKIKCESSQEFHLEIRKRWMENYSMEELTELFAQLPKPARLHKFSSQYKNDNIDFIKKEYVPFLKSIKSQIKKERIEKFQREIDNIKRELAICIKAKKENQIQSLRDDVKNVLEKNETEKELYLKEGLLEINNRFELLQLIPSVFIFQKNNISIFEKALELAKHFEDIYNLNKEKLFEYEMHFIKSSTKEIAELFQFVALDISIPERNAQVKKVDDILAILLL